MKTSLFDYAFFLLCIIFGVILFAIPFQYYARNNAKSESVEANTRFTRQYVSPSMVVITDTETGCEYLFTGNAIVLLEKPIK